MKTIAIANQKGGTGKTTTTYNLGIALTQQGYRVLMVDFDPQGNLSCYCGIPPEKDLDQTITELLMKTSCEKPIGNRECVYQTGRKEAAARVDFIPSNLRLAGFELAMGTMMCREVLLKSCLEQYNNQYDYCLIDNAPDINISTVNALVASDEAVIPVKIDSYAFDGLIELKNQIEITREELNPGLRLAGCLITCFQRQAGEQTGEDWLRENLDCPVYKTHIRYSGKVVGSSFEGKPIVEYSKTCGASRDYISFVDEYLGTQEV